MRGYNLTPKVTGSALNSLLLSRLPLVTQIFGSKATNLLYNVLFPRNSLIKNPSQL